LSLSGHAARIGYAFWPLTILWLRLCADRPSRAVWRTSSYTNNGGACVEVADNQPGIVAVRDSKDRHGPILAFGRDGWQAFVRTIKDGQPGLS
jgi:uncharacterized protein DUF397